MNNDTPENHAGTGTGKIPLQRLVMPFFSLPVGSRFRYLDEENNNLYVVISRDGCGTISKWEGSTYNANLVQIMSAFESEREARENMVAVDVIDMQSIRDLIYETWSRGISADEASDSIEAMFNDLSLEVRYDL